MQIVPAIADEAAHVSVFQRTPPYVLPRKNPPFTDAERARGVVAASAGNHAQGVALAAGLLHYRAQIDGELSGARLKPLVELCGEELFDRVCAAAPPPPEQRAAASAIPGTEELLIVGRSFLDRPDDPGARALAQRALALVAA